MTNTTKLSSSHLALRLMLRLSSETESVFLPWQLDAMKENLEELEGLGWILVDWARATRPVRLTALGSDMLDGVLADAEAALDYRSTWVPIS